MRAKQVVIVVTDEVRKGVFYVVIFKNKKQAEACKNDLQEFFNAGSTKWQSLNIATSVEHVYETRWDCCNEPEGVRL